jgi:hypothetical protein
VHLPGINTPQFEHCRNRFGRRSRPVAPIYQPEVAADAIHWAAHHRRRELLVGGSTAYTVWGSKLAPWLAEWHLARTGVEGQLTDLPQPAALGDNLHAPPPGDPGAHGPYDEEATTRSPVLWAAKRRRALLAAAGGALAAGAASLAARRG